MLRAQRDAALSNLRTHHIRADLPLQRLDSLTLAAPLLALADSATGQALPLDLLELQNTHVRLDTARLRAQCPDCRSLRVQYRVLPFDLSAALQRLDTASIRRRGRPDAIEYDYTPYANPTQPWESGGLATSGAYTRGLSFGNNQNLVFNSNLNLQLAGKLGNDLELQAALSDNSAPLQPDGTTRQLQEFDRIFIQIKRKNLALTAGDYDLARPTGYFSNYFKRLQGAMFEGRWQLRDKGRDTFGLRTAAAVSRGKFARQIILGQEGNQGPYRLQGAEGERFIIVLAGTEKVFLDGQLLRRGLSDDYVMDYNLGELSFTPKRLITKDSRVIVEFEYAVQTYLRATLASNASWALPRGRLWLNYYSEQDSRSSGGAQDLKPAERQRLAEVGDDLRNAFASGVDTLGAFEPGRVLYRYADTLVCGQPRRILRYSTNPDSARFAARFSEVPFGQGNYVLALSAANGRVYRWVAPDPVTCQPQGNFEPLLRLIAPEQRQLYSAGLDFQSIGQGRVQAELALSNRDLNRFSPLGDGDNLGLASYLGLQQPILGQGGGPWRASLTAHYERTAREFLPLNPYRPAEFVRDWNTDNSRDTVAEQLAKGGFLVENRHWGSGRYEFGAFRRDGAYDGQRHFGQLRLQRAGYALFAETNLLQTGGGMEGTRFSRPKLDFSKTFFRGDSAARRQLLKAGFYFEREKNARTASGADTLQRLSFWYDLMRFYFQTPENQGTVQWGGYLSRRKDFAPTGGGFTQNTEADELNLNGRWQRNGKGRMRAAQQLGWNFSYRNLRILAAALTPEKPLETYLGRLDYNLSAWRNALSWTTGYELGSGQSPRIEFNYLAVNPGEGQYTWVDRNRDSILQVDEMEIAVFQDQASYIRVAVSTPDYIRTNNVLLNQNLRLEPRLLWPTARRGWRRTLGRFSTQSTAQVNRRSFVGAQGVSPWNPLRFDIPDTALVAVAATWRNILFVNRANPLWDASIGQGDNRSQVALTTGFEQRRNRDWNLHGRLNLSQRWSLEADWLQSWRSADNQAFNNRDFDIAARELGPKITWLPTRSFRVLANVKWKSSLNALGEQERAEQTNLTGELTWNPQARQNAQGFRAAASLRLKLTFADIRYQGQANTPVAFTMLEGLQDGKNLLWNLVLDRQMAKNVQLNLNYEGRKTGANRTVHVARAQVRAVF
jgi:hypothetical protein